MLAMLLILQGVAGPPAPRIARKTPPVSVPCPEIVPGDEIIVCGRPDDQRLGRLPEPQRRAPEAPLTFRLPGGGQGNVHAVQSTLPGATGSGAVVSLRFPFGRSKPATPE